ncbi:hypothetical protein AXG93_3833s1000 [Marchantia polymorpha subsp. ruderalis]|uniref:Uncharacterized protein n=1 Tax=Marchantia polymorpha subsp. ruderalis TaxID=1480154 RepID=A0A176VLM7_MARPO|nr:hypothetical protein AXG93_3833s1000 [Marchantia polymorpha subsp. ruderalis]
MEIEVKPSEESMATVSLSLSPSERMQPMEREEVPQLKTSKELAKELTLSEEILEQVVPQVGGTVVDSPEVSSPPPPEKESLIEKKDLCASSERNCTSLRVDIEKARKATIDLRDRLEASRIAFNEESRRVDELTADLKKRDHLHAAELVAKKKECRAEEERKAVGVRRRIAALKTKRRELRGRIGARTETHSKELQRANELMANLAEQLRKHEVKLVD